MNVFQKIKEINTYEILISIILITLPLGFAINSNSVFLFFLFVFYKAFKNKIKPKYSRIVLLFIIFYLFAFLSLFWSTNITNTKLGLVGFLSFLAIPLCFLFIPKENVKHQNVFFFFSLSVLLYSLYCFAIGVYYSINKSDFSYLFYHKLTENLYYVNAIYFSVFVSFVILYLVSLSNKKKFEYILILFLYIFLLLLSSKLIITITSFFVLTRFIKKRLLKEMNIKFAFLILAIILVIPFASSNVFNRVNEEIENTKIKEVLNTKDFGHVYLWTGVGLRVFQAKVFFENISNSKIFFLGYGLRNSQQSLENKYREYNLYPGFYNYNYHNQYIQVFAELGFIGFIILILILLEIIRKAYRNKDFLQKSFIFLIMFVFLTESFLWRQRGMIFFIVISLIFYLKENKLIENKKLNIHKANNSFN